MNSFAEYVPLLLTMTPIYASLVGEPLLVVAGAIHVLTHDEPSAPGPRMILTGGAFIAGWSTFAMALWPPDVPVRVVIGVMAAASIVIIGAGLRLRRRGGEVSA